MTSTSAFGFGGTALLCVAALCLPSQGRALELDFPASAELVASTDATDTLHPIATGPWTLSGGVPTSSASGVVQEFTWQITEEGITTASLLNTLRPQLEAQSYTIPFTCFASACGGFDFRHALPVGHAPEMYVDLGDFHYLAATSEDGETHAAIMISRGGATGFVHLALIRPPSSAAEPPVIQSTRTPTLGNGPDPVSGDLIAQLLTMGSAPLDDLQFESGASELSGERYASLITLAAFLAEDLSRRVVLVGHTDASGSLSGNIGLSRARALNVRRFLTETLGVAPVQIEAQGIGFLAPRAANDTTAGREANRRVEVVLVDPG